MDRGDMGGRGDMVMVMEGPIDMVMEGPIDMVIEGPMDCDGGGGGGSWTGPSPKSSSARPLHTAAISSTTWVKRSWIVPLSDSVDFCWSKASSSPRRATVSPPGSWCAPGGRMSHRRSKAECTQKRIERGKAGSRIRNAATAPPVTRPGGAS